jgi:hypothetical protein
MDPYLEPHWRDVHTRLMVYACDRIQEQLPGDLVARVEESLCVDGIPRPRDVYPDVRVVERRDERSVQQPAPSGVAVAEPYVVALDEQPTERHVEILERGSEDRVITVIEVLSPSNKVPADGREAYRKKQREYISGGVNLVEVDLIRDGRFVLAVPMEKIPPSRRAAYMACVRRSTDPTRAEVYPAPLRERLPVVPIPLRPSDRDASLDLQDLVDTCYARGRYESIDYTRPLDPPLDDDDDEWAAKLLREAGLR